jgi:hypothetical protein
MVLWQMSDVSISKVIVTLTLTDLKFLDTFVNLNETTHHNDISKKKLSEIVWKWSMFQSVKCTQLQGARVWNGSPHHLKYLAIIQVLRKWQSKLLAECNQKMLPIVWLKGEIAETTWKGRIASINWKDRTLLLLIISTVLCRDIYLGNHWWD